MSSEGDSSKNLSSESTEKGEADNTDSSQEVKDAKSKSSENSVEKKEEDSKAKDEASDESDKKADGVKTSGDKSENAKADVTTSDKKDSKAKAKEEEEEENSEEEDEDEEKNEKSGSKSKEVPLLDQPLEKSGKRERKNVDRFNEDFPEPKEVEFPDGVGTSLGNIPRVDASISRFKNDDMKLLHKILFKTPGKSTMIKKNIKKFSGFDFKKDSDEYAKKLASMQKCEVKQLKSICEMLDLQKVGNKEDIVERILDFLLEPKDSGKAVGGGRPKRTAAVRANNRGYSSHDNYSSDEKHSGRSGRDKGRRTNLKDDSSSASDEDFEPSDEGSDEKPRSTKRKRVDRKNIDFDEEEDDPSDVESASSDEDSDFQDEPKSKRKKTVKVNNKNKGKGGGKRGRKPATPKKPTRGKKNKESSEDEEEEEEESEQKEGGSSSSEDEPLVKKTTKTAQPPTDEEIKTYVKEILEGANLEQITMKTVCQQVYAHYPDFDLAHKKDFIKSTVKSLIST